MARDRKARAGNRMTITALANVLAAIVDAMGDAQVPAAVTHRFLDRLDDLNELQLWGEPLEFMTDIIDVMRRTVPSND